MCFISGWPAGVMRDATTLYQASCKACSAAGLAGAPGIPAGGAPGTPGGGGPTWAAAAKAVAKTDAVAERRSH